MRDPIRIKPYLKLLKKNFQFNNKKDYRKFKAYWNQYPDQRLPQALYNYGGIFDNYYHTECAEFLHKEFQIPYNKLLFWTSNYDKDMKPLEKPVKKRIKDLDTNHLLKLVEGFDAGRFVLPREEYLWAFMHELLKRTNDK